MGGEGSTNEVRAPAEASEFGYRPALDGVRAIAVMVVLLYHGGQMTTDAFASLPGGYLGVDLFFVLSGYLITTLLLLEWNRNSTIAFTAFWIRRARRLLPALITVLGAVSIVYLLHDRFSIAESLRDDFPADALSTLFYAKNWASIVAGQSYFEQFDGPSLLKHMWSLAIEEQFYLLWPVLAYVGLRFARFTRRAFMTFITIGIAVSVVLMAVLFDEGGDPSRAYYGSDTRAQTILVGALLAFVLIRVPRERLGHRAVQALSLLGLLGCAAMFALVTDDATVDGWMYRGGFLLMAIAAALFVAGATGPSDAPLNRALALKPIVWIGSLSYGLYLWHWPIFVVLDSSRLHIDGPGLLAVRLVVTFAVSYVSYRFIEFPFRHPDRFPARRRRPLLAVGAAAVVVMAIAVAVVPTQRSGSADSIASGDGTIDVAIIGDSFPLTLIVKRNPTAADPVRPIDLTVMGCGFVPGLRVMSGKAMPQAKGCDGRQDRWLTTAESKHPELVVVMVGPWDLLDRSIDGRTIELGSDEWTDLLVGALDEVRADIPTGNLPLVIVDMPCWGDPTDGTRATEMKDQERVDTFNRELRDYAASHPGKVTIIDLHSHLCPTGEFTGVLDGVKYTDDGAHFNAVGAPVVWRWLAPQLSEIATRSTGG